MINEDAELALGYLFDPAFEFTNTAGKPLTGGYIELYVHGTRNKYYAYSDWNGTLHPFQIPLDGLGSNIVLVSPQFTYDAYIYSKYGTLQMSRYNVSPVGVGEVSVSGINEIVSNDGTVDVSQYGDTFNLSVPDITAVSGLVEDVAELTTAVSSIQEDIENLSSAVSGKKDKQEPYSFSETNRYTVSSLSQNADGNVSMGSTKSVGSEYTVVHSGTTSNKLAKIAEFKCYSGFSRVGSGFTNLVVSVSDAGGARQAMISVGLTQAANGNHNFAASLRYYVSVNQSSTMELKKVYLFSDTPYGNSQVQATISLWAEFTDLTQKQWTFKAENNYATPGTGGTPKANAWEFANGQRYPVSALPTGGWQLNSQDPMYATQTPDWNETNTNARSYIKNKPNMADYVTQEELATAVSALSVQSDWEQSDNTKPDYIKNKPDMSDYVTQEELVTAVSGLGVQSDWTEDDQDSPAYIQNKPEEKDLVAGDGIDITVSGTSVIISSDNPTVTGYATEIELAAVSGALQLEIETVSGNPRVKTVEYGVDRWTDVVAAMNGVSSGKYDYVVMKYTSNGIDLYAPLIKYEAGSSAFFACPAHVSDTVPGYGERRATEIFIINSGDMWFDKTIRPFQGKLIGRGNVSITEQGEDYIVSGVSGSTYTAGDNIDITNDVISVTGTGELIAGNNITITTSGTDYVISSTGGGSSYTAGDHIDITNDTISVTGITELVAGNAITITASGASAIISSNGEAQVQSDWKVTDSTSKAYIKNKPTIPAAQVQSNWNETNTSSKAYIRNKPTIHTYSGASGIDITNDVISLDDPINLVAGNNITIEVTGVSAVISSTGGGTSYSAGNMISLANNAISVSTTAGITDIQQVAALPANPVSSVLYLIPEV